MRSRLSGWHAAELDVVLSLELRDDHPRSDLRHQIIVGCVLAEDLQELDDRCTGASS